MNKYTLARESAAKISKGQAQAIFKYLQPYASVHTLDEVIRKAELEGYKSLFNGRGSPTIRESLTYHLRRFAKNRIVRVIED
jgi:hypothetical protein